MMGMTRRMVRDFNGCQEGLMRNIERDGKVPLKTFPLLLLLLY